MGFADGWDEREEQRLMHSKKGDIGLVNERVSSRPIGMDGIG